MSTEIDDPRDHFFDSGQLDPDMCTCGEARAAHPLGDGATYASTHALKQRLRAAEGSSDASRLADIRRRVAGARPTDRGWAMAYMQDAAFLLGLLDEARAALAAERATSAKPAAGLTLLVDAAGGGS